MTKDELKQGTYELVCDLVTELKASSRRIDIRERVAIIAMILRHGEDLWGSDESDRGSAVKRYEGLFTKPLEKAAGHPGGTEDPGPAADDDSDAVRAAADDDAAAGNGADPESCVPRNAS